MIIDDYVLLTILKCISPYDTEIYCNMAVVCKQWNRVLKQSNEYRLAKKIAKYKLYDCRFLHPFVRFFVICIRVPDILIMSLSEDLDCHASMPGGVYHDIWKYHGTSFNVNVLVNIIDGGISCWIGYIKNGDIYSASRIRIKIRGKHVDKHTIISLTY